MQNKKRYIIGGLTIAAAATTAHLMQSANSGPDRQASVVPVAAASAATFAATEAATVAPVINAPLPAVETDVVLASAENETTPIVTAELKPANGLPVPPMDALMPAPLPQIGSALRDRMAETTPEADLSGQIAEQPIRNQFGLTCGPILSASVDDAAMVSLTLTAPCKGDEAITIRHGALAFTDRLNHLGTFTVKVPAMTAEAGFVIEFSDGTVIQTDIDVAMPGALARVALLYRGEAGLQIHALEFGADYGEAGHVWSGAPRDATSALKVGGGYLTVLGDTELSDALRAEVYTYPGDPGTAGGLVKLSVEAEVTALNCATELAGQTIERITGNTLNTVSMTVAMPDCSAVGEYLVLKNLLRDLKIASN